MKLLCRTSAKSKLPADGALGTDLGTETRINGLLSSDFTSSSLGSSNYSENRCHTPLAQGSGKSTHSRKESVHRAVSHINSRQTVRFSIPVNSK
ncbi:hypothetical protein STEG23_015562, partial [Scotinomys teguina]